MCTLVTKEAPDFTAQAVMPDNTIKEDFSLSALRGKHVVLFFYPLDFTFVCPTEIIAFNRKLGAGFFGGEGFILQKLKGDGKAFMHAGGTIIERELKGQKLRVDTGCLVAFSPGIEYNIERAGNLKSMFFGGEGLFVATLSGHGRVWLQSLPFSRLADRILRMAPSAGGKSQGEGSVLGGIGRMIDGS